MRSWLTLSMGLSLVACAPAATPSGESPSRSDANLPPQAERQDAGARDGAAAEASEPPGNVDSESLRGPRAAPEAGVVGEAGGTQPLDGGTGLEQARPASDAETAPSARDAASGEAGASAPVPAAPCGSDLDVANGRVVRDLGVLPNAERFSGTPSDPGAYGFSTASVTVPIQAGSLQAAGQNIAVSAGSLNATAYTPNGAGPFPLVLVLAGFQASYSFYDSFSEHFASHGFAVLGVDTRSNATLASHDKEALEVLRTIDFALSTQGPFAGKIDPTKIVVAGHSKGGKVAFYAAALDPRIDLVIGWDPVNAGGGPCAFDSNCNNLPVAPNCAAQASGVEHLMRAESLVIGAPPDPLLNPEATHNADNFYRGAPSPAWFVRLAAGHGDWVALFGNADVIRITKAVQISLLLSRMRNVTGLEAFLPGGRELSAERLLREARRK